jgi:hypothetical protein
MLDALTVLLGQRMRDAVRDGDPRATGTAKAVAAVEQAKTLAARNVNPQLLSAALMRQLECLTR